MIFSLLPIIAGGIFIIIKAGIILLTLILTIVALIMPDRSNRCKGSTWEEYKRAEREYRKVLGLPEEEDKAGK